MNSIHHGWSLDEIAPEARRAAERAAEAAGMPLEIWLNQLIKYVSAMELSGKGPARARAIDETIKRAAAEQARIGPVDGPALESDDTPMMLEAKAPIEQPTTVAAEMLQPNRFAEEHPGERDVEQAIGEWRKSGALKPLVVRPDSRQPGHYEIVSGMERWHAASRLHMRRIPVTVQQLTDEEVLRATLIQKLNSKSLPPLDEAQIYQRLMEETGLSVATLSDVIGRSPTHVATALQLLDLPEPVREMINSGELSVLHARTLLGAADPEPAAREVVSRRLDIYQTEQLVRASHGALTPPGARAEPPAETEAAAETKTEAAAPAAETAKSDEAAVSVDAAAPPAETEAEIEAEIEAETTAEITVGTAPDVSDVAPAPAPSSEPAASEPEASAPAGDTAEAPLDMAEFITTDTAAPDSAPPENAPDTVDTTSPIILGGPEGDASTLIEASPAIDRPAADSTDMAATPEAIPTPEKEAPETQAPGVLIPETQIQESQADDSAAAGLAAPQAPIEPAAAPDALAVPGEEKEPEPTDTELAATGADVSEPPAQAISEPQSQPQPQPMEIPAAAAVSEERPAGEAPRGGNGDDREGHRDTYMSESAPSALSSPAEAEAQDDYTGQVGRDEQDEARNDDSTRMVETHLSTLLGLKVSIAERNQDDGVLSIHYNSESELTDLVSRLNRMPTGRRAE